MDDIHIKLNLLNYTSEFCKIAEKKPIHKFYFALADPASKDNDQLYYFLELCYWIMGSNKKKQAIFQPWLHLIKRNDCIAKQQNIKSGT